MKRVTTFNQQAAKALKSQLTDAFLLNQSAVKKQINSLSILQNALAVTHHNQPPSYSPDEQKLITRCENSARLLIDEPIYRP